MGENRPLATDEQVEFEKQPIEVQDSGKLPIIAKESPDVINKIHNNVMWDRLIVMWNVRHVQSKCWNIPWNNVSPTERCYGFE